MFSSLRLGKPRNTFIKSSIPRLNRLRTINTMAAASGTAHQILITPQNTGLWRVKQTEEAASKVSELLQKDLNVSFMPLPAGGIKI